MRRAARTDATQIAIVEALRQVGASVQPLHAVGAGCPDLLVGFRGRNVLVECKRPPGPRGGTSDRELTPAQEKWHREWAGQVAVVDRPEAALGVIGIAPAADLADEVFGEITVRLPQGISRPDAVDALRGIAEQLEDEAT